VKKKDDLDHLRKEIDCLDAEILKLLNKRASVVLEVGKVKKKVKGDYHVLDREHRICLLYTSPSPRDATLSRMPSSA